MCWRLQPHVPSRLHPHVHACRPPSHALPHVLQAVPCATPHNGMQVLLPGGLSRLASPLALLSEGGADSLSSRFESLSLAVPVEADLAAWQTALAEELKNAKTQAGDEAAARGFTVQLQSHKEAATLCISRAANRVQRGCYLRASCASL